MYPLSLPYNKRGTNRRRGILDHILFEEEEKMDKFRLSDKAKEMPCGTIVYRIEALIDIPYWDVNKGDMGGFVEWEENLSQREDDYSWVGKDAVVMGRKTKVEGATIVTDDAIVQGDCLFSGAVRVSGDAHLMDVVLEGYQIRIYGSVKLYDVSLKGNGTTIGGKAKIYNVHTISELTKLSISGNVSIEGSKPLMLNGKRIAIRDNVVIEEGGEINGTDIHISGKSNLIDGFKLKGTNIRIQDFAVIVGDVRLGNNCTMKDLVELTENDSSFSPVITDIELSGDVKLTTGDVHEINT
jgi:acetyltransferase-like isoleucine patch superfamily enzyme